MKFSLPFFCLVILLTSCQNIPDAEQVKKEVAEAESDFQAMAAEKGIAEAFWFFAADSAVIKRQNDSLIKGRENIRLYYSTPFYAKVKLTWSPEYIEVADGGDLAYTYGDYLFQTTDSTGSPVEHAGVFHTVWKKQQDGSWKYVWD